MLFPITLENFPSISHIPQCKNVVNFELVLITLEKFLPLDLISILLWIKISLERERLNFERTNFYCFARYQFHVLNNFQHFFGSSDYLWDFYMLTLAIWILCNSCTGMQFFLKDAKAREKNIARFPLKKLFKSFNNEWYNFQHNDEFELCNQWHCYHKIR